MAAIEIGIDSDTPPVVSVAGSVIRIELPEPDQTRMAIAAWLESLDPQSIEELSLAGDRDLSEGVTAAILETLAALARGQR